MKCLEEPEESLVMQVGRFSINIEVYFQDKDNNTDTYQIENDRSPMSSALSFYFFMCSCIWSAFPSFQGCMRHL